MTAPVPVAEKPRRPDSSLVETIQSLVVAFVLAMAFRGFITEGFVIPTGSMAPTLLGQHVRVVGAHTGWELPIGHDDQWNREQVAARFAQAADPMLGRQAHGSVRGDEGMPRVRMGDRILVLKSLYPFSEPSRYDVVVFKNPTNPNGDDGNYIKRLLGLPNEALWIVDGDLFVTSADHAEDHDSYRIARKPPHVQRGVWQPIHYGEYVPMTSTGADLARGTPWHGAGWDTTGRSYRCDAAGATALEWDAHATEILDWTPYNELSPQHVSYDWVNVSDLRVQATLVPDDAGLAATFELETRGILFQIRLAGGAAIARSRPLEWGSSDEHPEEGWTILAGPADVDPFAPRAACRVSFEHVDQAVALEIEGRRVLSAEYDWAPRERLARANGEADVAAADIAQLAAADRALAPALRLRFEGSALTLHRVHVDRDIFYRHDALRNGYAAKNPSFDRAKFGSMIRNRAHARGTHPSNVAVLGPDHYFMGGDNSTASSDSRLWGNPHPLVALQIDPTPFVVHRRLLLGKAWVVYFPAPLARSETGRALIPDFGRLRFIR
jgi:signal peptidase I